MTTELDTRKGLLITAIGGLLLSFDIPLIRLAHGEAWSVLMVRSGLTLVSGLAMWALWRRFGKRAPPLLPGRDGVIVASLYGLGSITFILAVFNTASANVVFILTFNMVFSALLSWLFLGEKPRTPTLLAIAVMIGGVALIVWDGFGRGGLFGDAMALCSTFSLACAITLSRATGKEMGFASLVGVVLPFIVACTVVSKVGFKVDDPKWIIFNSAVMTPLAFFCLATGPRYIAAAQVAMFYLLETILAPVWIWIVFSESPSRNSLIGGTILVVALVAHSVWQLSQGRLAHGRGNLRHPA